VSDNSTTQCLLLPDIFPKAAVLQFDQRQGSSDGGALLLKAADRRYGLIAGMADCLRDERRRARSIILEGILAQRVFSIACGYPTLTMRPAWPPIRFTRCYWTAIRRGRIWLRSLRCRALRMPSERRSFIVWRGAGGQRDPAPCPALARSCAPRHPRSGSDRRSHSRAAQLSFFNRHYEPGATCGDGFSSASMTKPKQYLCAAVLRPATSRRLRARWGFCAD